MLKGKAKTQDESSEQPGQYRDNPKVNARIDEYIKNNTKHWEYIQSMPRERLERALVLSEVNKLDRQEKINAAIMRKLDQNPEIAHAFAATHPRPIIHDTGRAENSATAFPASDFTRILTELREELIRRSGGK